MPARLVIQQAPRIVHHPASRPGSNCHTHYSPNFQVQPSALTTQNLFGFAKYEHYQGEQRQRPRPRRGQRARTPLSNSRALRQLKADDAPQPDSAVPDEARSRESAPIQCITLPDSEADLGPPVTGVDLSTINDPAAAAAAFASSDSATAATTKPTLPGDVPPARFGVHQVPSSFVVGVPANHADRLMRDGYGGLEAITFVESLSDEDIRDLSETTDSRLSIRPELLLPRSADSTATVPEFRDFLGSLDASRKLASLLRHYPVEGLARKVLRMSTLLKRTLEQFGEAKRQLRSNGSQDDAV
ncbi:hypothetical protein PF001_g8993 [Phytophthora fragariae]|uniref:Uncharacterized protein n=1 Tax=Phytophthora fragariae TaxID=53985 RepID=A0A6A4DRB9_9STRA|nr:hypothetical protein PF001_g8993 [Phytophthora fragariae]